MQQYFSFRLFIEGTNVISSGNACLRFAYNMNGYHMGTLLVYVIENGVKKEKWKMVGDQLQNWRQAAVDLRMNSVSQVKHAHPIEILKANMPQSYRLIKTLIFVYISRIVRTSRF